MIRRKFAGSVLAVFALILGLSASFASADGWEGIPLPSGVSLLFTGQAEGVQIYVSKPKTDGAGFEWSLKSPEATLYDFQHKKIGTHYAGPTWEALDGSKIVAAIPPLQRIDAPDKKNVPWLLIAMKPHDATGLFGRVDYLLRVDTTGGTPPAAPPARAGQEARVKYRAAYLFLTKTRTP